MTTDGPSGSHGVSPAQSRSEKEEKAAKPSDLKRTFFILLGVTLFAVAYFLPQPPAAVDPMGEAFPLTREGRLGLGLFLLAATWWVTEVIPIGVTAITIGVVQGLFLIRPAAGRLHRFHGSVRLVHHRFPHDRHGVHQDGADSANGLQDVGPGWRADQHDLPGLLRHDLPSHSDHGPYGGGGHDLPAPGGGLRPLYRRDRAHPVW